MGRLKPKDLIFQYYGFAPHGQQGAHSVRIVHIYSKAVHSVGSNKLGIFLLVLGVWESGWVTDSEEADGEGDDGTDW